MNLTEQVNELMTSFEQTREISDVNMDQFFLITMGFVIYCE